LTAEPLCRLRSGTKSHAGACPAALRLAGSGDTLRRAHLQTRLGRLEAADLRYEAAAAAFDAAEALLGQDPGGWTRPPPGNGWR
jgi:hypothetical protein